MTDRPSLTSPVVPAAEPARRPTLDYQTPRPQGARVVWDVILGIIIGVLLGVGGGLIVYAVMVHIGMRDQVASLLGMGVTAVMIGLSLIALLIWLRSGHDRRL